MRILAHRGAPDPGTTENTIPAIGAALTSGADGVEVDLRMTADGVLAACHDPDLSQLTGRSLPVASTPWHVLRRAADVSGFPLARVEWVIAGAAGRPVLLELKPARSEVADVLVDRLVDLHLGGVPLDITVSSFDRELVAAFRAAVPPRLQVRTALLGAPGRLALATLRQALADGHDQLHPHVSDLLADPEVAAEARACGVGVVPWTVNSRRTIRRCAELGVDAVITDVPRQAMAALARRSVAA